LAHSQSQLLWIAQKLVIWEKCPQFIFGKVDIVSVQKPDAFLGSIEFCPLK